MAGGWGIIRGQTTTGTRRREKEGERVAGVSAPLQSGRGTRHGGHVLTSRRAVAKGRWGVRDGVTGS